MRCCVSLFPVLAACLCIVGSVGSGGQVARAQDINFGPGPGGSIPNNSTTGFTSNIVVAQTGAITDFKSVTITGLQHTLMGDLWATLTHVETGTAVDLFNRVGKTTADEFDFGDNSNFAGNYTFVDDGASLVTQAQVGNTSYNIPSGTYGTSTSQVAGQANAFQLSAFEGQNVSGTWSLVIRDLAAGDVGSFTGWQFTVTTGQMIVPEPGTAPLMAAGVLMAAAFIGGPLAARRRRMPVEDKT